MKSYSQKLRCTTVELGEGARAIDGLENRVGVEFIDENGGVRGRPIGKAAIEKGLGTAH